MTGDDVAATRTADSVPRGSTAAVSRRREHVGVGLVVFGLVVSALSFLGTLEPLNRIGIWYQSETVVALVFLAAAICAVGLAVLASVDPSAAKSALFHPLALLPWCLAVWSLATSVFAPMPMTSILGSPQLGQGALSQLALGIFVASALSLRRHRAAHRLVVATALLAIVATAALTLFGSLRWRPYFFPDFLAFHAIFAWAMAVAWLPRRRPWLFYAVTAAAAALMIVSENRAGVLAMLAGAAAYACFGAGGWSWPRRHGRIVAVAAVALLPIVATGAIGVIASSKSVLDSLPLGPRETLISRGLMGDVVLKAVSARPMVLATGAGWGHYRELLVGQLRFPGVKLYTFRSGDTDLFYWDALIRADFHSHNFLAEALAAGGIVAALLALGFFVAIPLSAGPGMLPAATALAVSLVLLQTMWFQMPIGLGLMAIAVAGLSGGRPPRWARRGPQARLGVGLGRMVPALAVVAAAAELAGAGMVIEVAAQGRHQAELTVGGPQTAPSGPCTPVLNGYGRGSEHFVWLLRRQANVVLDAVKARHDPAPNQIARLMRFLCVADRAIATSPSLRVAVVNVIVRSDLAFLPDRPDTAALRQAAIAGWPGAIDVVLKAAPARTDVLVPYFSWALKNGRDGEILSRAEPILRRDPNDAVALWFSGLALLGDPATANTGMDRLKKALRAGIQETMPISPRTLQDISRATAPR